MITLLLASLPLPAQEQGSLRAVLERPILAPGQAEREVADHVEGRAPRMPEVRSREAWERQAARMRRDALKKVILRGEAERWAREKGRVEWLETVEGGPGYRIRKLRYEALPGLWIPALLYEPETLRGRVPVVLNVNGHDGAGKAADYKQIRCINQAKRGMLALNPEWLGMGQLREAGYHHELINALDLCGTSGIAAHYLAMTRALDLLLDLPNADPKRAAVTGLSGGGWQTIFLSAFDTRVTLANPVAGYSSFRTRARFHTDLGDSEQTPVDLATVTDYAHMTAMRAPRPTLLTYNAKDDCCFKSGHALPPLLEAAGPVFRLFGREENLRSHVNHDPGTHNYLRENREALYRMLGDHFYRDAPGYSAVEIPSEGEVKRSEQLHVPLPEGQQTVLALARALARDLPRGPEPPAGGVALRRWQTGARERLREVVRAKEYEVRAERAGSEEREGRSVTYWKLRMGEWTVPAVEITPPCWKGTALLFGDGGRGSLEAQARERLGRGERVVALDPFYLGESRPGDRAYLWALFVSTVGDRPLGLQASQVAAAARWAGTGGGPVSLVASGRRATVAALTAAGLEPRAVGDLELHGCMKSLKELPAEGTRFSQAPELFCFGLLERFDIDRLAALAAPRTVRLVTK